MAPAAASGLYPPAGEPVWGDAQSGPAPNGGEENVYKPKPYEQMTCPGQQVQVDVKVKWYARRGIQVECIQTDNGFEFTNRFSNSKRDLPTLFEATAAQLGIRHKLIRPYTPCHNGKAERSHREEQKQSYNCHSFYSLDNFAKQLAVIIAAPTTSL